MKKNKRLRTGVMGGSFNPFHLAHLNSLLSSKKKFDLDELIVIPSFRTPLKEQEHRPRSLYRLNMLKHVLSPYPFIKLDDREIQREGVSYTYKTINQLFYEKEDRELFFIIGLDQFYIFDQWKNQGDILNKANLIVTSRPGMLFPKTLSDYPLSLKALIKKHQTKKAVLDSGKHILFFRLKDMNISSSDIRKRIQQGQTVAHLIPKELDVYIKRHKLYTSSLISEKYSTKDLINLSKDELQKQKAYDVSFFDLRSRPLPFSFGLIATASNTRHTKALALHLKKIVKKTFGLEPIHEEGMGLASWIVLDYGDLVIHIFYDYVKKSYKLEELWNSYSAS